MIRTPQSGIVGIPVEAAMLAAGHRSTQMHLHYVHLQASDIGRWFGTATSIDGKKSQK